MAARRSRWTTGRAGAKHEHGGGDVKHKREILMAVPPEATRSAKATTGGTGCIYDLAYRTELERVIGQRSTLHVRPTTELRPAFDPGE